MADDTSPQPTTIQKLSTAVYPSFAMLAGMQLDVFSPLKDGPMTAEQLANALGVKAEKLSPLLYALVATELLTVDGDRFSNTPEADHYLVKGKPTYMGGGHGLTSHAGTQRLKPLSRFGLENPKNELIMRQGHPKYQKPVIAADTHQLSNKDGSLLFSTICHPPKHSWISAEGRGARHRCSPSLSSPPCDGGRFSYCYADYPNLYRRSRAQSLSMSSQPMWSMNRYPERLM